MRLCRSTLRVDSLRKVHDSEIRATIRATEMEAEGRKRSGLNA